jgi:serine/threonine protein kinase
VLGRNEARAYRLIGKGSHENSLSIFLEWVDHDLEDEMMRFCAPVLQQDVVAFWQSLFFVASAISTLHNLASKGQGLPQDKRYKGWHGDIKPSNILRAGDRWLLGDLGLTHLPGDEPKSMSDKRLIRTGETYGAPERIRCPENVHCQRMQAADIWSLACVFSLAATWVVLGPQGLEQYREIRVKGSKASSRVDRHDLDGKSRPRGDFFHDGRRVHPEVTRLHRFIHEHKRKSDDMTSDVLRIIDEHMFVDWEKRISASRLEHKLAKLLEVPLTTKTDHQYESWRGIMQSVGTTARPLQTASMPQSLASSITSLHESLSTHGSAKHVPYHKADRVDSLLAVTQNKMRSRRGSMNRLKDAIKFIKQR